MKTKFQIISFIFLVLLLTVSDQPTYAADKYEYWSAEHWGEETNGIRAGLDIRYRNDEKGPFVLCVPWIHTYITNTNLLSWGDLLSLWIPPFEKGFQLSLLDTNGNAVAKTAKGKALGERIKIKTGTYVKPALKGAGLIQRWFHTNQSEQFGGLEFKLGDYFDIKKPGKYRLECSMRVVYVPPWWKGDLNNENVPILYLPPVNVEVEIKETEKKK